jgi:hypothetical protein
MTKYILTAAILFFISCANNTNAGKENDHVEGTEEAKKTELELNNGRKWKLDETTRQNIAPIRSLLNDTAAKDLQNLARELQQQTDKLVSECKMKGEDHEALHHWLETWLTDLGSLKSGKDMQKAFLSLRSDIGKFDAYFE